MVSPVVEIHGRSIISNLDIDADWVSMQQVSGVSQIAFGSGSSYGINLLSGVVDWANLPKMDVLSLVALFLRKTAIRERGVEETSTGKLKHMLNVRQRYVAMWQGFHIVSLHIL